MAKENANEDGDCAGMLALCYAFGFGTDIKDEEKKRWSEAAIEKGTAMGVLGYFILEKYEESVQLLRQLLDDGVSVIQNLYAFQCQNGLGMDVDEKKAFEYYSLAAEQGDAMALSNLGYCYQNGSGVERDLEMGFLYYAASSGRDRRCSGTSLRRRVLR